jgi:hypothetical protein
MRGGSRKENYIKGEDIGYDGLKKERETLEKAENKKGGKDERGNAVGIGILYRIGLVSMYCMQPDGGFSVVPYQGVLATSRTPRSATLSKTLDFLSRQLQGTVESGKWKVKSGKWKVQGGN